MFWGVWKFLKTSPQFKIAKIKIRLGKLGAAGLVLFVCVLQLCKEIVRGLFASKFGNSFAASDFLALVEQQLQRAFVVVLLLF